MEKIFEAITKLGFSTKATTIGISFSIPQFFIAIYFFKKSVIDRIDNSKFYDDLDFWFMVFLCFAMSIAWYVLSFVISAIFIGYNGKRTGLADKNTHMLSVIFSQITLSGFIALCYYNCRSFDVLIYLLGSFFVGSLLVLLILMKLKKVPGK